MAVRMRMRPCNNCFMGMRVMGVMHVNMVVLDLGMGVFMFMTLGHMQPRPQHHQQTRHQEFPRHDFMQECNGNNRSNKRCQGKVSSCSCGSEMAKAKHEHNQAYANAE